MANTDVIAKIIELTSSYFTYMLPIIGLMAGITFMVTWFTSLTMGLGRRTFKA
jgi:hypothetical protein